MIHGEVNIPLLRKAVEWAEVEAEKPLAERQWDQGWWVIPAAERASELGISVAECGTAYCIAGWTCFASGETFRETTLVNHVESGQHVGDRAAQLLGIPLGAANSLFNSGNSIADVRRIAEEIAGERL